MAPTADQSPPPPQWRVIAQTPGNGRDAAGHYVPGHDITAALASGTQFKVFVPDTAYTVSNVRDLLNAKAAQVAEIDTLRA